MLLKEGKTNFKYILVVVILTVIVGGGILAYQYWWVPREEAKMPGVKMPEEVTKIKKLDLSTPEKTFSLYIEAIKNENFELIRKLYSKKQQQDLVERNINLMQEAVKEGKVLWKVLFFLDEEQEAFIVEIDPMQSGYVNLAEKETYKKLYSIDFNVGSRTYSIHFVLEDGEWRIPGSWDTYEFEK